MGDDQMGVRIMKVRYICMDIIPEDKDYIYAGSDPDMVYEDEYDEYGDEDADRDYRRDMEWIDRA